MGLWFLNFYFAKFIQFLDCFFMVAEGPWIYMKQKTQWTLDQVTFLQELFSDNLFVLRSKMIHRFCFFVFLSDFFRSKWFFCYGFTTKYCKFATFVIHCSLYIPNIDNSNYVTPFFYISQLFLERWILLGEINFLTKE